jgi:hypothetical protein
MLTRPFDGGRRNRWVVTGFRQQLCLGSWRLLLTKMMVYVRWRPDHSGV